MLQHGITNPMLQHGIKKTPGNLPGHGVIGLGDRQYIKNPELARNAARRALEKHAALINLTPDISKPCVIRKFY